MNSKRIFLFPLFFIMVGCVGKPPIRDYNIAAFALEYAKKSGAQKFEPLLLSKAEETYARAVSEYEERDYENASKNFVSARKWAEKAELKARYKKFKSGEGFP